LSYSSLLPEAAKRGNASASSAWRLGAAVALSVGFLDATLGLLPSPPGLERFLPLLAPLAATTVGFFLLYAIGWFLFVHPVGRFLGLRELPLAAAFSLLVGTFFLLALLSALVDFPLDLGQIFRLLLLLGVSLLLAVMTYRAGSDWRGGWEYGRVVAFGSVALPLVLLETLLAVWLHKYVLPPFFSLVSLGVTLVWLLVVLASLAIAARLARRGRTSRLLAALLVVVVCAPVVAWMAQVAGRRPPATFVPREHPTRSVILITVDTLRADALSAYSRYGAPTPNLDALARDGVVFRNAYSAAPWTLPSLASIVSGLSPLVHQTNVYYSRLPGQVQTLAEYMREAGYLTGALGINIFLDPVYNLAQGFVDYRPFASSNEMGESFGARMLMKVFPEQFYPSTAGLTRQAVGWLESHREQDFFLWVHYYDPHDPYAPPPAFLPKRKSHVTLGNRYEVRRDVYVPAPIDREWIQELYRGEVRYVDAGIGELVATLKRLQLYDDSLIVLTSDHGEEFWEHGGSFHGYTLYNEVLRVPLIIKLPGSARTAEVETPVANPSVMPTVLELCGVAYDGGKLSYPSLAPLWGDTPQAFTPQPILSTGVFYHEEEEPESLVFGGFKYIRWTPRMREELYDLGHDPGELVSVAAAQPEKLEEARALLESEVERARELQQKLGLTGEEIKLEEEMKRRLRGLGYVR
jgi:arylsulfatase A-like enzyme